MEECLIFVAWPCSTERGAERVMISGAVGAQGRDHAPIRIDHRRGRGSTDSNDGACLFSPWTTFILFAEYRVTVPHAASDAVEYMYTHVDCDTRRGTPDARADTQRLSTVPRMGPHGVNS